MVHASKNPFSKWIHAFDSQGGDRGERSSAHVLQVSLQAWRKPSGGAARHRPAYENYFEAIEISWERRPTWTCMLESRQTFVISVLYTPRIGLVKYSGGRSLTFKKAKDRENRNGSRFPRPARFATRSSGPNTAVIPLHWAFSPATNTYSKS